MIAIKKTEMVFQSIIDLCNQLTTCNISHHRTTIKFQAEYGLEQLSQVENNNVDITIDRLFEKLEITAPKMNYEEVVEMLKKALQPVIIEEKNNEQTFIPFGPDWESEVTKMPKKIIVELLKKSYQKNLNLKNKD